jgi:AraC family transcriptional regulator
MPEKEVTMATSQVSIIESKLAEDHQHPVPVIFERTAEWEGVKIGHYRVEPGSLTDRVHKTAMVFVPLSGSITIEDKGEGAPPIRRRTVGDVSITPAGKKYGAHWEEELEHLSVFMAEDFLDRATIDFEANRNAKLVIACNPQDALVRSIAIALVGELGSEMPNGRIYAESLVNTLAVHLLRHYSTDSVVPDLRFGGLQTHKLRRVADFMYANLDRNLTLAEIAQEADLSLYHFARAFKQTTGLTPIQFLTQRRIERAKQLLADSEMPLAEIALNVGFKNQSHFTTLFRKFTEMTPKAWRNFYAR